MFLSVFLSLTTLFASHAHGAVAGEGDCIFPLGKYGMLNLTAAYNTVFRIERDAKTCNGASKAEYAFQLALCGSIPDSALPKLSNCHDSVACQSWGVGPAQDASLGNPLDAAFVFDPSTNSTKMAATGGTIGRQMELMLSCPSAKNPAQDVPCFITEDPTSTLYKFAFSHPLGCLVPNPSQ